MVHPRPKSPLGESVAKPETPLLIILNIACKYEVNGNLFSPVFEKQSPWTKTSQGGGQNRISIPNISIYIMSKYCQHPYRTTSAREGQATTGYPFPRQQTHNYMLRQISIIQIHSYIYIYICIIEQTVISIQAKLEAVRRKHFVHPTRFCAYSSTCCKGINNCAGSRSAPILRGRAVDTRQCQRRQTSFGTYCRLNSPWWECTKVYRQ